MTPRAAAEKMREAAAKWCEDRAAQHERNRKLAHEERREVTANLHAALRNEAHAICDAFRTGALPLPADEPTEGETIKPWDDSVPLRGEGAPKNDGRIKHLIEYLLTVHRRFGNTAVTTSLQWGGSACRKMDEQREKIEGLERRLREREVEERRLREAEQILSWLELMDVEVRKPAMYGSFPAFKAFTTPGDEGCEDGPSDLREKVRAALVANGSGRG